MKIKARLKADAPYETRYVGCKQLTKKYSIVDVTDEEQRLIEASDIAEWEELKPAKKQATSTGPTKDTTVKSAKKEGK